MSPVKHKRTILISLIVLTGIGSFFFWLHGQFYLSTDDAYINGNVVQISPRVTGQVSHLYVQNNQLVKQGDALFDLDSNLFETTLIQAKAQLSLNESKLKLEELRHERMKQLVLKKFASTAEGDTANSDLVSAKANVDTAKANLTQAELNLQYTKITAPSSGWITNLSLREGTVVTANQPYFALISDSEFWIDTNFKETDLKNIHPGQKANIKIDMYPGHNFSGVVESISSGSGTVFSLLPPENATGNWVKVTQRIPVRVKVTTLDPHYPLRIGASATVTVHMKS